MVSKVLLHRLVDGPLQASHCLVLQSLKEPQIYPCILGLSVHFKGKAHLRNRSVKMAGTAVVLVRLTFLCTCDVVKECLNKFLTK